MRTIQESEKTTEVDPCFFLSVSTEIPDVLQKWNVLGRDCDRRDDGFGGKGRR